MVKVLRKVKYGLNSGLRHGFKNVIFSKVFFGFITSLSVLISSHDKAGRIKDNLDAKFNEQEDTFDFIVVGGGTAGALVANRLSEGHKVLVLEAGGEPHPLQRIPGMAFFMVNYREIDWMHRTTPQRRACFASPSRRASWSQGMNLGGSSNLNFMVSLRGSPRDYDHWAKVTGDDTWTYENTLPYFRRHENYQGDSPDREAHGFDGELKLEVPSYTGMAKEFIRAGQELGYEHVDLNARYDEGFDTLYYPIEGGERRSAYSCFLEPIRERETLVIRKYAHVNRLLIRGYDNTAYGVEYDRHGRKRYAYATKEVILCGGTVESAKLLMLSGIGPKTHLADLGIPMVADLPVGKNLQDHMATLVGPFFIDPPRSYLIDRDITIKTFYEYKADGTGPLSTSLFQAAGMISSKKNKWAGSWNWPDIQLLFSGLAGHKTFAQDLAHAFHLSPKLIKKYYDHALGRDSFFIAVTPSRPYARGEIMLEKRDPYAPLNINPRYLQNDHDLGIIIEGIKTSLYLVENTTSFQNLRARFTNKKFPGCEHMPFRSDEYFECYIRHFSVSLNDPVGTCAMGHPHMGKDGVLDSELQVIGVNHLRVVDASVMPTIPGGPVEAAVLMIAEKASDIIMEAWRTRGTSDEVHHHHNDDENNEEHDSSDQFVPHGGRNHYPNNGQFVQDDVPLSGGDGPPFFNDNGPPSGYGGPPMYGPPPSMPDSNYGPPSRPNGMKQYWPPSSSDMPPPFNSSFMPNDGKPPMMMDDGPPSMAPISGNSAAAMNMPPPMPPGMNMPLNGNGPPPGMSMPMMNGPPMMMGMNPTNMNMNGNGGPPMMGNNNGPMNNMGPPPNMPQGPPMQFNNMPFNNNGPPTNMPFNNNGPPPNMPFGNNGPPPNMPMNNIPPSNNGMQPPPGFPLRGNGPPPNNFFNNNNGPPPNMQMNNGPFGGQNPPFMSFNNNNGPTNFNGPPPFMNNGQPRSPNPTPNGNMASTTSGNSAAASGPSYNNNNNEINMITESTTNHPLPLQIQTTQTSEIFENNFDFLSPTSASPTSTIVSAASNAKPSRFDENTNDISNGRHNATRPGSSLFSYDNNLKPGLQVSNPHTDEQHNSDPKDTKKREFSITHPITSSLEYPNKIPTPLELGPIYFRNPEYTTKSSITVDGGNVEGVMPEYPQRNDNATHEEALVQSVLEFDSRRTAPPKVLYNTVSSISQKIPSTANIPDIYYKIKDVSSLDNLNSLMYFTDGHDDQRADETGFPGSQHPHSPLSYTRPYWTNVTGRSEVRTTATPTLPTYLYQTSSDLENATTPSTTLHPAVLDSSYFENPPPILPMANEISTTHKPWTPVHKKITIIKSRPSIGRVVRIKSGNIGLSVATTTSPAMDEPQPQARHNKIKIRIKHKNNMRALSSGDDGYPENHQNIEPYFSQGRMNGNPPDKVTKITIRNSSNKNKPMVNMDMSERSNNKDPFSNLSSPITITPRPLLSVTIWPNEHNMEKNNNNSHTRKNQTETTTEITEVYGQHNNIANFKEFESAEPTNATMEDSEGSSTILLTALAEATMDALQGKDPDREDDAKEEEEEGDNNEPDIFTAFAQRFTKSPKKAKPRARERSVVSPTIKPPEQDMDAFTEHGIFSTQLEEPFEETNYPDAYTQSGTSPSTTIEYNLPDEDSHDSHYPERRKNGNNHGPPRPPWTPSLLLKTTTPDPESGIDNTGLSSSAFSNIIKDKYGSQYNDAPEVKQHRPDPTRVPISFREVERGQPTRFDDNVYQGASANSESDYEERSSATENQYSTSVSYSVSSNKSRRGRTTVKPRYYKQNGVRRRRPTTHRPIIQHFRDSKVQLENNNQASQQSFQSSPPPPPPPSQAAIDYRKRFKSFYSTRRTKQSSAFGGNFDLGHDPSSTPSGPLALVNQIMGNTDAFQHLPQQNQNTNFSNVPQQNYYNEPQNYNNDRNNVPNSGNSANQGQYPNFLDTFNTPGAAAVAAKKPSVEHLQLVDVAPQRLPQDNGIGNNDNGFNQQSQQNFGQGSEYGVPGTNGQQNGNFATVKNGNDNQGGTRDNFRSSVDSIPPPQQQQDQRQQNFQGRPQEVQHNGQQQSIQPSVPNFQRQQENGSSNDQSQQNYGTQVTQNHQNAPNTQQSFDSNQYNQTNGGQPNHVEVTKLAEVSYVTQELVPRDRERVQNANIQNYPIIHREQFSNQDNSTSPPPNVPNQNYQGNNNNSFQRQPNVEPPQNFNNKNNQGQQNYQQRQPAVDPHSFNKQRGDSKSPQFQPQKNYEYSNTPPEENFHVHPENLRHPPGVNLPPANSHPNASPAVQFINGNNNQNTFNGNNNNFEPQQRPHHQSNNDIQRPPPSHQQQGTFQQAPPIKEVHNDQQHVFAFGENENNQDVNSNQNQGHHNNNNFVQQNGPTHFDHSNNPTQNNFNDQGQHQHHQQGQREPVFVQHQHPSTDHRQKDRERNTIGSSTLSPPVYDASRVMDPANNRDEDNTYDDDYQPPPSNLEAGQVSLTYDDTGSTSWLDQPVIHNGDVVAVHSLNGSEKLDVSKVSLTSQEAEAEQHIPQQSFQNSHRSGGLNNGEEHPNQSQDFYQLENSSPIPVDEDLIPVQHDKHQFDGLLTPTGRPTPTPNTFTTPLDFQQTQFFTSTSLLPPVAPQFVTTHAPVMFGSRHPTHKARDPHVDFGDSFTTPQDDNDYQDYDHFSTTGNSADYENSRPTLRPFVAKGLSHPSSPFINIGTTPSSFDQHSTPPPNESFDGNIHSSSFPILTPTPPPIQHFATTPRPQPKEYTIYSDPDMVDITEEPLQAHANNRYDTNYQADASSFDSKTHLRRRADILQRRRKRRRNMYRYTGRRYHQTDRNFDYDDYDEEETERPFRRHRRPHSRRRFQDEVENYPFKRRSTETEPLTNVQNDKDSSFPESFSTSTTMTSNNFVSYTTPSPEIMSSTEQSSSSFHFAPEGYSSSTVPSTFSRRSNSPVTIINKGSRRRLKSLHNNENQDDVLSSRKPKLARIKGSSSFSHVPPNSTVLPKKV